MNREVWAVTLMSAFAELEGRKVVHKERSFFSAVAILILHTET